MHSFARPLPLLILSISAAASCNAFLVPIVGSVGRSSAVTGLRQSPSGDDDDGSNAINIALITASPNDGTRDKLQAVLNDHPFSKMTGTDLRIDEEISTGTPWSAEEVARLRRADVGCFATASSVKSYLRTLDERVFEVDDDSSEDDRRKLPNKPQPDDINNGAEGGDATTFMAICPNTNAARECLNSGRWMNNHIYYPKDTQAAVKLKTAPLEEDEGNEEGEAEEEDIDFEVWAEILVQAAGDVMESKFWGDGW